MEINLENRKVYTLPDGCQCEAVDLRDGRWLIWRYIKNVIPGDRPAIDGNTFYKVTPTGKILDAYSEICLVDDLRDTGLYWEGSSGRVYEQLACE